MAKPPPSEWGKLNSKQYYCLLAIDVDRALACAEMGKYEQVVMQYVRERTWGKATRDKGGRKNPWPEPRRLTWSLPRIADETGLSGKRLCEAKASLVSSAMLIEDDGTIQPNKNASAWVFPPGHSKAGQPRLSPALIAYATQAQNWRAESTPEPEDDSDSPELHSGTAESHSGTAEWPFRCTGMAIPVQRNPIPVQRNGHIEERASEDSPSGRLAEDLAPSEQARTGGRAGGRDEDETAQPRTMPDEFASICRKADVISALKDVAFGPKLRGAWSQDGGLPAWWSEHPGHPAWTQAMLDLASKPADKRNPAFYLGMVKRLIANPRPAAAEGSVPRSSRGSERLRQIAAAEDELARRLANGEDLLP